MRYLLNSAVLTTPGEYEYHLITEEEAITWLKQGNFISRVGYPANADHILRISGIKPELSREITNMQSGDEALVVRLKYRIQNPKEKATFQPGSEDWEYGILIKK